MRSEPERQMRRTVTTVNVEAKTVCGLTEARRMKTKQYRRAGGKK
jgi:hypothetical protein|tara:strand:+ start:247 stop:381 length:135 start_codon:yes stop_codon:yes gene_type:complete